MPSAPKSPAVSRIATQDRDRHIHVQVSGSGEPTVVLLTGLGTPAAWWHGPGDRMEDILTLVGRDAWDDAPFLAPALAQRFRVVTYDRAGMQDSTPPAQPRTMDDFLQELEAVLRAVDAKHPVVLIGHSIGGLIALAYARRFPDRVHALVLLDSSHPDQLARFAGAASADDQRSDAERRHALRHEHPERPDLDALLCQGNAAARPGCLGDMPLLVISRGVRGGEEMDLPVDAALQDREKIWQNLQTELVACSTQGQHVHLASPFHYVYLDQPETILQAMYAFLAQCHARP
ncbi:alpha/beta hydrolase (plasmid) [Deinococcus sp. KNUC1210]|uniref:alpha/beta fold hydrolase n=1 Tax=Deinococcus sp. KNUC1210 TaxID=2917691 RepID=UPI001EF04E82|nr:alpha/beta fold hydrolase [Deinococcus sp. KNUC1210]ULH13989.1 alpha/beta hydrolase [Deinococcus sp. KNUC1210]